MPDELPKSSLYDRIGGAEGVDSLVDQFYLRVFDDPELAPFFEHASVERLKSMQHELFSQALGGPLSYTGRPLRAVHHGRGIKMHHFQLFIGHLLDTLAGFGFSREEMDMVIARINVDADKIVGQSTVDG